MIEFQLSPEVDKNKIFLVQCSELEGRFDCDYYLPALKENIDRIKKRPHFSLGDKIRELQTGYNNKQNFSGGLPFLRTQNVRPIWLDTRITTYTEDKAIRISKYGDLLFTRIGVNVGDVGFNDLGNVAISDNVILARLDNSELAKFCAIFLITNIGKSFLEREKRDTARAIISYENINKILIPDLTMNIRLTLIKRIDSAYTAKKQKEAEAQQLLDGIDDYLLGELGIELPQQEENTIQSRIFTRKLSEISGGRFDAEYYQNKYVQFENAMLAVNQCILLKGVLLLLESGSRPSGGVGNIENGILSFGGTHVSDNGYISTEQAKYIPVEYHQKNLTTATKINDLLLVKDGATTGKIAIIQNPEHENQNINEHIFLMRLKDNINPIYLLSYLKSSFGSMQVKREITGATVTGLTKDVVENLKIPLPPLAKQTEIAHHITNIRNQAKQLQQQAKEELEQAKKEVELMILGEDKGAQA